MRSIILHKVLGFFVPHTVNMAHLQTQYKTLTYYSFYISLSNAFWHYIFLLLLRPLPETDIFFKALSIAWNVTMVGIELWKFTDCTSQDEDN